MTAPNPFIKQFLMTAGPTPLPPAVMTAMAEPMLYHRSPAFDPIYAACSSACRVSSGRRTTC